MSLEFRIASSLDERWAALELVYDSYLRAGLITANQHRVRVTPYHLLPTTEIFVAVRDGYVTHTMSLVADGELGIPMQCVYGREVGQLRAEGYRFAEVSCLAGSRESPDALLHLYRFIFCFGLYRDLDYFLIAVHPRHARFYQRVLAFEAFAGERSYPTVRNHPAVALKLDLRTAAWRFPPRIARFYQEADYSETDLRPAAPTEDERLVLVQLIDPDFTLAPIGDVDDYEPAPEYREPVACYEEPCFTCRDPAPGYFEPALV